MRACIKQKLTFLMVVMLLFLNVHIFHLCHIAYRSLLFLCSCYHSLNLVHFGRCFRFFLFACFTQQWNHSTKLLSQFFFFSWIISGVRHFFACLCRLTFLDFWTFYQMLHSINSIRKVVFAFDNYFWPYFMSPTPLYFMNVSVKLSSIQ